VVIDAALLLEWGLDDDVDQVWVVHASQENRLNRLEARGISRDDAHARQKLQLSSGEFRRRADVIIENDGSIDDLRKQVERELGKIEKQSD
jgi:dephospho-CoA kinase